MSSKLYETSEESENVQEIFVLISSFIFLVIYIVFFYHLRKHEQETNKSKRNKIVTNPWILILPTIYASIYCIRYLLDVIKNYTESDDLYLRVTLDLGFVLGNIVFYMIMILRLKLGFKGTEYELTKHKLIICFVLLFVITMINIFYYLIRRNGLGDDSILKGSSMDSFNGWNEDDVHTDLFIALVFFNIFLAGFLVYNFVRNIVLMIVIQIECSTENDVVDEDLSAMHLKWLSIAIKYALLCGIAIMFTNIQFTGWILFSFDVFEEDPFGAVYYSMTNDWLWDLVLITNYLCILLTFPLTPKLMYDKLCKSCHGCCQSCIKCCILSYVQRKHRKPAEEEMMMDTELQLKQSETFRENNVVIGMHAIDKTASDEAINGSNVDEEADQML